MEGYGDLVLSELVACTGAPVPDTGLYGIAAADQVIVSIVEDGERVDLGPNSETVLLWF